MEPSCSASVSPYAILPRGQSRVPASSRVGHYQKGLEEDGDKSYTRRLGDGFVLGPTLSLQRAPLYHSLIPLCEEDTLLCHHTSLSVEHWRRYNSNKNVPIWPGGEFIVDFQKWARRLLPIYEDTWKRNGIYDLISLCLHMHPLCPNLITVLALFWSRSSNCFIFPWGPMTITLWDVTMICGASLRGTPPSAGREYNYPSALNRFIGRPFGATTREFLDSPTDPEVEHVVFIWVWLNSFVANSGGRKLKKELVGLAQAIASGREIALAPFFLAHLYRGLRVIVSGAYNGVFSNGSGPLWLLFLWYRLYFPPDGYSSGTNTFPLYHHLLDNFFEDASLAHYFRRFYTGSSLPVWTPYMPLAVGPPWVFSSASDVAALRQHCLAQILVSRDLHFGLDPMANRHKPFGCEVYNPHYCSRQLRFTQDIPYPFIIGGNDGMIDSTDFREGRWSLELDQVFELLLADQVLLSDPLEPAYNPTPSTTQEFDQWWGPLRTAYFGLSSDTIWSRLTIRRENSGNT